MRNTRSAIPWLVTLTILLSPVSSAVSTAGGANAQEMRARWLGAPEHVGIPKDAVVGISVSGGRLGTVWIADQRAPLKHRLVLKPIAPGRYAVALDDPKLARIAKLGGTGFLRVFAVDAHARWTTSAPLSYRWSGSGAPGTALARTSPKPVFFLVQQRSSVDVPESAGSLRVRLGDISGGAVGLTVWIGGKRPFARRFVRAGDRVPLALERPMRLQVLRLVNRLFGEDHALLMVCPEPPSQETLIEALIRQALHIGLPCYHGDDQMHPEEIERRLRKSLAAWRAHEKTLAGFLAVCAKDPDLPTHYRWFGDKRKPFIELLQRFAESLERPENAVKKRAEAAKRIRRAGVEEMDTPR